MLLCHCCGGNARECGCRIENSIKRSIKEFESRRYYCPNCDNNTLTTKDINIIFESISKVIFTNVCKKCKTSVLEVGKDDLKIENIKLKEEIKRLKKGIDD